MINGPGVGPEPVQGFLARVSGVSPDGDGAEERAAAGGVGILA
jgi:hypothetical protein